MISEQRLVELVRQADSMVSRAVSGTTAPAIVAEVFKVLVAQEPERQAQQDRDEINARLDRIAEENFSRVGATPIVVRYHGPDMLIVDEELGAEAEITAQAKAEIARRQFAAAEGERSLFEHRAGRAL